MKTFILILLSSLFVSSMSNKKEKDSIKKILNYKIEETEQTKNKSFVTSRTPIIILKRD